MYGMAATPASPFGILTEDFTANGQAKVTGCADYVDDFRSVFGEHVDPEQVERAGGITLSDDEALSGRPVLFDCYPLFRPGTMPFLRQRLPLRAVQQSLSRNTVTLPRRPELK